MYRGIVVLADGKFVAQQAMHLKMHRSWRVLILSVLRILKPKKLYTNDFVSIGITQTFSMQVQGVIRNVPNNPRRQFHPRPRHTQTGAVR